MNLNCSNFFDKEGVLHLDEVTFTFDSVTYANKAKKLLQRVGVTSKLIKLTRPADDGGCVHGLTLSRVEYYTAIKLLREYGIAYKVTRGGNDIPR